MSCEVSSVADERLVFFRDEYPTVATDCGGEVVPGGDHGAFNAVNAAFVEDIWFLHDFLDSSESVSVE